MFDSKMSVVVPETENPPADKQKQPLATLEEKKNVKNKKDAKRKTRTAVEELTSEEREAVTIVFHQYETGLREGTIFTKVMNNRSKRIDFYLFFGQTE